MKNSGSVKIRKIKSRQLVVRASVNGVSGSFVLDTGAGSTIIDRSRREKFHIAESEVTTTSETAIGAGGSGISLEVARIRTLSIARKRWRNVCLFLMDLDNVNKGFKEAGITQVDGILGGDILSEGRAVIDYDALTLTVNLY